MALLFINGIIAARTISARHQQLDFFPVHVVPGEAQLDSAHIDNPSAIPTNVDRKLAGSSRLGGSCDDHAVRALRVRQGADLLLKLRTPNQCTIGAQPAGQLNPVGLEISGDHAPPLQAHQLRN